MLRLLPTIHGIDIKKIHHFSDQLVYCVQSLETMGKLEQVNGYVSMILHKLPGIRGDLVRTDEEWETWDFVKLCKAIQLWARRNPIELHGKNDKSRKERNRVFHSKAGEDKRLCVHCGHCGEQSHKSTECTKVSTLDERRKILAKNGYVSIAFNQIIVRQIVLVNGTAKNAIVGMIRSYATNEKRKKKQC